MHCFEAERPSDGHCRHTEVPAEVAFEPSKEALGHPAEVPDLFETILRVTPDAIGENVVHLNFRHAKVAALQNVSDRTPPVGESNRATRLGFRMSGHQFF